MHRPSTDANAKLFIAVRADIPVGLAAAQSVHAAFQFAQEHPDLVGPWMRHSQYLVVVSVPDERDLIRIISHAHASELPFSKWAEPDMGGEYTAAAFAPGDAARRLCANLPLFGRELALV